jgi:hypothetical protein
VNERIREIELQPYVEVITWETDPPSGYQVQVTTTQFSREKFAQLIVQDCVDSLRQAWYQENNKTPEPDARSIGIHVGIKAGITKSINTVANRFQNYVGSPP